MSRARPVRLALALTLALGGLASARAGTPPLDLGAVSVPDLFEPALPFLDLQPEGAGVLSRCDWRFDLSLTVANDFALSRVIEPLLNQRREREPLTFELLRSLDAVDGSDGVFFVDGEVSQVLFSFRRGFRGGVELRLDIPWRDVGPGFLDPLVEPFHRAFGFDRAGRGGVPRNAYTLYVRSDGRVEVARDADPDPGIGDVTLSAKGRLPSVGRWRLALEGSAKLPTGDEESLYGSGSLDLGLQLHGSRPLPGSWGDLHLTLGSRRLGSSDLWGISEQTLWSLFASWVRPFGDRRAWDLFFQLTLAEVPFESLRLEELARETWLFDLGVRRRFPSGRFVWVALTENQFTYQSSADFELTLGLGWAVTGH